MKKNEQSFDDEVNQLQGDSAFHDLFGLMEDQPDVPDERYYRVKSKLKDDWKLMLKNRRQSLWQKLADYVQVHQYQTVAASLVLVVGAWLVVGMLQASHIAIVDVVSGVVNISDEFSEGEFNLVSSGGDALYKDQYVVTGSDSGVGLKLNEGQSLRLDVNSKLKLVAIDEFYLVRGAVYFDSDNASAKPIVIKTEFGEAKDIGTQFEVRVLDEKLRVRVREGKVELKTNDLLADQVNIEQGKELMLDDTGAMTEGKVKAFDSEWSWTEKLAPKFQLEGKSLDQFLNWISRENGWELEYRYLDLESYSKLNILHGSIDGMQKEDALAAVSMSGGVDYILKDGQLIITSRI